jgi:hypothetical protein
MRNAVLGRPYSNEEARFWLGSYHFEREEGQLFCYIDVKQARHGVKFKFKLTSGGKVIKIIRHQSYPLKNPNSLMGHALPQTEEQQYFAYRPGFL